MYNKKIPVIFDVDAGIDDAVGIVMATSSPKIEVKLITTCMGNVDSAQVAENVLNILNVIKRGDIPVAIGADKPLKREKIALAVHGSDGMGDCSHIFPKHGLKPIEKCAHDAMADVILESKEPVVLVCVAPLTNIAKLLIEHPETKANIKKILFCGGSIEQYKPGELPYFGFNVMIDPEACEMVLSSGVPIEICPSDMGHIAYLDYYEVYQTKNTNSIGQILEQLYRKYKDRHIKNGIATHDSCAVCFLTNPEIFKTEMLHVFVGYYGENKTGVLRCEWNEPRNFLCATGVDAKAYKKLYFSSLRRTKTIFD